jgi:hypothetical protein
MTLIDRADEAIEYDVICCVALERGFVPRVISEATVGDQLWQIRI